MGKTSKGSVNTDNNHHSNSERFIYVMPSHDVLLERDDQVDLLALGQILWRGRWLVIGITTVFAFLVIFYALTAEEWYRAEVLLAPAKEEKAPGLLGQIPGVGNLADLTGIRIGGGGSVEPLAVLKSRDFIRAFIEDQRLLPVFLATRHWWQRLNPAGLDSRDGVKFFSENVLRVYEDNITGLVTVAIEWTDPGVAADWANLLVERLNDRMRERSLREAESNLIYLKQELASTQVVALQQSISRLLERELQNAMMTRVNEEFAFRVLDRAETPKWRSWPKRTQLVALAVMVGVLLSSLIVLLRHAVRRHYASN